VERAPTRAGMVGVTGFEPATPASRTQCSGQAELHPDSWLATRQQRDCHAEPKLIAPRTRQRECGPVAYGEPRGCDAVNR
jgi:hypothetical protein